jgi:hypothetical protein
VKNSCYLDSDLEQSGQILAQALQFNIADLTSGRSLDLDSSYVSSEKSIDWLIQKLF